MKLIAIDVGSGFVKSATGFKEKERKAIPSIVTPFPEKNVFGMSEDEYIQLSTGEKYLTGVTAQNFGQPIKRFDTTNEDWHGQEWWKALLYKAISLNYLPSEINGETIHLATGIPQKIFSENRDELGSILNGEHKFSHGMNEYSFNIEATIIPQAAGALIFNANQDTDLLNRMVGIIDIGTFTTGLSVIDCLVPVEHKSTGCSKGMTDIYKGLSETLKREYSFSTDMAKMPGIVKNKSVVIMGDEIDISNEVNDIAREVSKSIIEKVNESWGNAYDMSVFITGGGSETFYEALKEKIPHLKHSTSGEPFYDVVLGMLSYAKGRLD